MAGTSKGGQQLSKYYRKNLYEVMEQNKKLLEMLQEVKKEAGEMKREATRASQSAQSARHWRRVMPPRRGTVTELGASRS